MQSFIIPLLYILLANATTVLITKKSFIKSLPLTLLFTPFPLFFSGLIFSTFKVGIIINILYALTSIVLIIIAIRKNKIQEFKNNYLTFGLLSFIILYIFIFIYDFKRNFFAWDDVSHWGLMVKEMFRLDNFYSINESTLLIHKDYPPIMQLYELFWVKLSGSFKECYTIRALQTFYISFLLPFLNLDNPIKKINFNTFNECIRVYIKTIIFIFIILLTLLFFDTHIILNTTYNDYLLSILVVYGILLIFFEKEKTSNFLIINLSILFTFIILTKQVSLAFYAMIFFFYIINIIKSKKVNKIKIVEIVLLLIIIPLFTMFIWNKYVDQFNIYKQFVISDIKLNELHDIVTNSKNERHIIVTKYKEAIINQNLSHITFGKISYLYSYIIYTILSLILFLLFKKINKKNFIKYYITITIGYIGYAIMMLILYLFCFKEEGFVLASFDRYMATYILIAFISLIIILIKYPKFKDSIMLYISIAFVIIILINKSVLAYVAPRLKEIDRTQTQLGTIANNIAKVTEEDSKVFILSQNVDHCGKQIYVNYYINPRSTNFKDTMFDTNCTNCEEKMKEYLKNYDYLYIFGKTSELNEKYPSIRPLKINQVYKIINDNENITFIEVNN